MNVSKTGKLIRQLRKERNMSQEELAAKVFITRQAVSYWEVGRSLPDSEILLELSDIFGISIRELLKGERNENSEIVEISPIEVEEQDIKYLKLSDELKELYSISQISNNNDYQKENKELETIALDLVDKYNKKSKITKSIFFTLTTIILFILFIFLIYYFITSYNTIQVYKISGEGDNFFTQNGIMINTKQKSYIRLGKLRSFKDENISKVELYYYDKNNNKQTLYKDNATDILLTDYYGYNELYEYKDLKYIINNLYLDIAYSNSIETIKLNLIKDFSNDLLLYKKNKESIEAESTFNYNDYSEKIIKALEKKGTKNENEYTYTIIENDEKINFSYIFGIVSIDITDSVKEKNIEILLNDKLYITYKEIYGDKENKNIKFSLFESKELTENEKEICKEIKHYVEYLLK